MIKCTSAKQLAGMCGYNSAIPSHFIRGYGGIGRRARFRIWYLPMCRFKSCYPHQKSRIILIRLFLSKPQVWHIITARSVVDIISPLGCISSCVRVHIFSCGLMIYSTESERIVFGRMICNFCKIDDIQRQAVDFSA